MRVSQAVISGLLVLTSTAALLGQITSNPLPAPVESILFRLT